MPYSHDALFKLSGYRIRYLQPDDVIVLQALLEDSSDFIQLETGLPPDPSAAYSLMTDCPEGRTLDEKAVIGLFTKEQELVGVLDFIRGYPHQRDWWIGLLLFSPKHRNQGLGQRVYTAFERWAGRHSVRRICLGVLEQNQAAYHFWQRMGFELMERRPPRRFGNVEHVIITMARALDG